MNGTQRQSPVRRGGLPATLALAFALGWPASAFAGPAPEGAPATGATEDAAESASGGDDNAVASETTPAADATQSSEAKKAKSATEADEEQPVAARNINQVTSGKKNWAVIGRLQFRTLAVTDEDPANGQELNYRLTGTFKPLSWLMVAARLGVTQRFVAQPDENGVRMQDSLLAALAFHSVDLAPLGWKRKISFMHRLGVFLPTSYQSQLQDMYATPEWITQATLPVIDNVTIGVIGQLQYRIHKFAERQGPGGGPLPAFVMAGLFFAEYSPLMSKTYGTLTIGADVYGVHRVHYRSYDQDSASEIQLPAGVTADGTDLVGAQGSSIYQSQGYGYDVYLTYLPPIPYLAFTVSMEHGGRVLRDGVVNTFAFHRDETQFAFTVTARY